MKGRRVRQSIATAGRGAEEWDTRVYNIDLVDRLGNRRTVLAFKINTITGDQQPNEVDAALKILPAIPDYPSIMRPTGPVDLLLGIQYAGLHLLVADKTKHIEGNLRLLTSEFGTGFLLDGYHPELNTRSVGITREAYEISHASIGKLRYGWLITRWLLNLTGINQATSGKEIRLWIQKLYTR